MEAASQQVSESASEHVIDEGSVSFVAAEDTSHAYVIAELDRRVRELEAAIGEVRSVKASATGRKTSPTVMASSAGVDGALGSLSVEQRIAVKSGLMRAGLL